MILVNAIVAVMIAAPAHAQGVEADSPAIARQQVRISALENEVSRLTGSLEEMNFRLKRMEQRLDKMTEDLEFRLQKLEHGGDTPMAHTDTAPAITATTNQAPISPNPTPGAISAPPPSAGPGTTNSVSLPPVLAAPAGQTTLTPAERGRATEAPIQNQTKGVLGTLSQRELNAATANPPPAPPSSTPGPIKPTTTAAASKPDGVLPPGSPKEQYDFAYSLLQQRNYEDAQTALAEFVSKYPEADLAGNAQYWLGETHYVRGQYDEAAAAFLTGYQKYKKNSKGPDNLLKLGMSLGKLGQTPQACKSLSRLSADYPDAPATVKQRAQRESTALGCK
ncbi:MAG: tol-pal system protein YbgF [Alphaproteobacteria bacterium]